MFRPAALLLPVVVLCIISACETSPDRPAPGVIDIPIAPAEDITTAPAVDAGVDPNFDPHGTPLVWEDPLVLADEYLLQSRSAAGTASALLRLSAAEAYMRAGRTAIATELLLELRSDDFSDKTLYTDEGYRLDLLDATRRFREGQYRTAMRILDRLPANSNVDSTTITDMLKLRAYAQVMEGDKAGAIMTLTRRADRLTSAETQTRNNNLAWSILESIPDRKLDLFRFSMANGEASPDLLSWIELAMLVRSATAGNNNPGLILDQWTQSSSLQHVDPSWLSTLIPPAWDKTTPRTVALLLPVNSRFAESATAVQQGFNAADTRNRAGFSPRVVFYDTGMSGSEALSYQQASADGADFIVGPLGRNAAGNVVNGAVTMLPTLLLGTADSGKADGVFQFDLDPDQEAIAAARRAFAEGHRMASIVYPQSNWGERLANSFWREWMELGGEVTSTLAYASDQFDYSEEIRQLLGVSWSVDRFREIDRVLRQPTEFQPRRRPDIDVIFLAARPEQGRLIRPQLSFHQAHDVPIYSTSHIYGGSPDPVNDADLDGVRLGVMPVVLRSSQSTVAGGSSSALPSEYTDMDSTRLRLYALGRDAYNLLPTLYESRVHRTRRFRGETGELDIQDNGRILRHLAWVLFEDGVITPVPPSDLFQLQPAMDTDELDTSDGITGRADRQ